MLEEAVKASLWQLAVYDENELVAYIRLVGDGHSDPGIIKKEKIPITVALNENEITVSRPNDERLSRSLHGLTRTLIQNLIIGVTQGYEKKLEIVGTGYRVTAKGKDLEFALGYSHSINIEAPEGISFTVEGPNKLTVSGIDKQLVGQVAANIRGLRHLSSTKVNKNR